MATPIWFHGVASTHGTSSHEVTLYDDGSTSCPCAGWIIKKPNRPRTCRHVNDPYILKVQADFKAGTGVPPIQRTSNRASALLTPALQFIPDTGRRARLDDDD